MGWGAVPYNRTTFAQMCLEALIQLTPSFLTVPSGKKD